MDRASHDPPGTVRTACSYCGVGCGMVLEVEPDSATGGRRVRRAYGDKQHPTNFGRLCTKGATSAALLSVGGRLETAYVRDADQDRDVPPTPTPTDAAITETARRLREILDEHGPDAVAFYVSGQLSLEAQYLANKLAKGYVRTNQIESNSRLCMASAGSGYKLSLGADGPPGSYQDFDHADVFLVIGSNMADCHPILFLRMMDRVAAGARLIVVDPRRTATADKADLYLPIRPGTDLALLNGLLHLVDASGHTDPEFIAEHTRGWERMPEFLADYPPDVVAELTGLPEADIRTAAEWIGTGGNLMTCWTMGLNQSTHGTWNTNAICNLHLATGTICRPGAGPFSLTGQPNAMGGREMGYLGPGLPGQRSAAVEQDREFVERQWNLPPGTVRTETDSVPGGTIDLFERMAEGRVRACWILCTNPVASVANRRTVIEGLEACELVIAQDVFTDTETNSYADILLPAAMWAESTGVAVNSERNLTLLNQAVDPPGEALPDWLIIARVAAEMGFAEAFDYASAQDVFDEIVRFANPSTGYDLRGISYQRLRQTPVQWPSPESDTPASNPNGRNPIRYLDADARPRFPTPDGRAVFFARPHLPPSELPDDDYPFLLNTGRLAHQWHTMTKTGKVTALTRLNPGPFVQVHPADARRLGIAEGDQVEVASRRGRAVLPASVSDRVQPGSCFAPFHWNDSFGEYLAINAVTNDAVDPISLQPEFKACAVTLTKVGAPTEQLPVPAVSAGEFTLAATPPKLTELQANYLNGYLWGARQSPGTAVPVLPETAPFEPPLRAWADGVLAALLPPRVDVLGTPSRHSQHTQNGTVGTDGGAAREDCGAAGDDAPVLVLWASQTGNAEEHAVDYAQRLRAGGHRVELVDMDTYDVAKLPSAGTVLVITSTFGDGDAPDNGERFWAALNGADAPTLASSTRFAVLAFGDSSYTDFCGHGRRLDERLAELGATRITARVDCEPGARDTADAWYDVVSEQLSAPDTPARRPATTRPVTAPVSRAPAPQPRYHRGSPLVTELVRNQPLGADGSSKEVRQFAFGLPGTEFRYAAGDALGVWPTNSAQSVEEWLQVTGLDGRAEVRLDGQDPMPLRDAARRHLEILRITPALLRFVQRRAHSHELDTLLRPGNTINLQRWLWGRQSMDLVAEFGVRAELTEWLDVLTRLQPRLYSISSSPTVSPLEVQLTVSAVRFHHQGKPRNGVCSTFLADHPVGVGTGPDVPVFVQSSTHFRPPAEPDVPIVMIGPGTGIAPFRAFLQERQQRGHTGRNWLFFGERNSATDFYYRDELERMHADGLLTELSLAFSRDQRRKVYVQDLMREHAAELWAWLRDGARIYVCGDAARMAKDVDRALRDIVRQRGHLDIDAADAYVAQLVTDRRYLRDVY